MLLYLDNCCFNRPYDDQSQLIVSLESQAKLFIQRRILDGDYQLLWSYVLEHENNQNPFSERRESIYAWKKLASNTIIECNEVLELAEEVLKQGIRKFDALHIACAIIGKGDYFLTVDKKLLNKNMDGITICNPLDFISEVNN